MKRKNSIQDNKYKVLLSIREERKIASQTPALSLIQRIKQIIGIQTDSNKDSAPRTSNDKHSRTRITSHTLIHPITEEDIIKDLHEGRE